LYYKCKKLLCKIQETVAMYCFKFCKILPICLNVIRGVQTCDTVHSNRITAFCDMTPYNLVYRYKYFEVDFCLHHDADRSTL
jgi:hypothetical protein